MKLKLEQCIIENIIPVIRSNIDSHYDEWESSEEEEHSVKVEDDEISPSQDLPVIDSWNDSENNSSLQSSKKEIVEIEKKMIINSKDSIDEDANSKSENAEELISNRTNRTMTTTNSSSKSSINSSEIDDSDISAAEVIESSSSDKQNDDEENKNIPNITISESNISSHEGDDECKSNSKSLDLKIKKVNKESDNQNSVQNFDDSILEEQSILKESQLLDLDANNNANEWLSKATEQNSNDNIMIYSIVKLYNRYAILLDMNRSQTWEVRWNKLPQKIKENMVIWGIYDENEWFNLLIGGIHKDKYLGLNFKYDIDKEDYKELAPMITPRIKFKVEIVEKNVLWIGGSNGIQLTTFDYYNWESNWWYTLPDLNFPHDSITITRTGTQIYVTGQIYDPKKRPSKLNKYNSIPIEYYNTDNIHLPLDSDENKWKMYYIENTIKIKINWSLGWQENNQILLFGFKDDDNSYIIDLKNKSIRPHEKMYVADTFSNNIIHMTSPKEIIIVGDRFIHSFWLSSYKWKSARKIEYLV